MSKLIRIILVVALMSLPVAGCEKEEKKGEFEGFSRMVKERHQQRQRMSDADEPGAGGAKKRVKKSRPDSAPVKTKPSVVKRRSPAAGDAQGRKGKTTTVQKVLILSEDGRRTLGRGIVYLDEKGKIIGIRVH